MWEVADPSTQLAQWVCGEAHVESTLGSPPPSFRKGGGRGDGGRRLLKCPCLRYVRGNWFKLRDGASVNEQILDGGRWKATCPRTYQSGPGFSRRRLDPLRVFTDPV